MVFMFFALAAISTGNTSYSTRKGGHIHGDCVADLPFPMDVRYKLVNSGRVSAHHFLPQSGWVSYWINKNIQKP